MKLLRREKSHLHGKAVLVAGAAVLLACGGNGDPPPAPNGEGGSAPGTGGSGAAGVGGGAGSGGTSGAGGTIPGVACDVVEGGVAEMVSVPAGEFIMGCNEQVDHDCEQDERPMQLVTLSEYRIDRTEVTQDQYSVCVQEGACEAPSCSWRCEDIHHPAGCVTRVQARTYCEWAGKRLPTEAEWEKAARGTDGRKYPWGNAEPECSHANMNGCGNVAEPVGSHPAGASPYGALDMAGNMVEMLADWYDPSYYQGMPTTDPRGPAQGDTYVGRGGGFLSDPFWQRASVRDWYDPPDAGKSLGFRCAQ